MSQEPTQLPPSARPDFSFRRLILYPLLVAISLSAFFYLLAASGRRPMSLGDRLDELSAAARGDRWQKAFDLAIWLQQQEPMPVPSASEETLLSRLLELEGERKTQAFLALVVGQFRLERCLPVLERMATEAPRDPDPLADGRVYAILALGEIGDPAALDAVLEGVESADGGVRKAAAFALGGIGGAAAVAALRGLLQDGVDDVRWNAALGLARLSNPSGEAILLEMADRARVAETPGIGPGQVADVLSSAVASLADLNSAAAVPLLEKLAAADPDLVVRTAAREGLVKIGGVS